MVTDNSVERENCLESLMRDLSATKSESTGNYCAPHGNFNCTGCWSHEDYSNTVADEELQHDALKKIFAYSKEIALPAILKRGDWAGVLYYANRFVKHWELNQQSLTAIADTADENTQKKIEMFIAHCFPVEKSSIPCKHKNQMSRYMPDYRIVLLGLTIAGIVYHLSTYTKP